MCSKKKKQMGTQERINEKECVGYSTQGMHPVSMKIPHRLLKKTSVCIVRRSGLCSCSPHQTDFFNRVGSCTTHDGEELFSCCLHVEALKNLLHMCSDGSYFGDKTCIGFVGKCHNCDHISHYDGCEDCILHVGKFLIHYEVMRDYLYQFLYNRSPMSCFYQVWSEHHADAGFRLSKFISYSTFRLSWYIFLELLDIDYEKGFTCETYQLQPEVLLFDGTSLAFQKAFLKDANEVQLDADSVEVYNGSSYKDRVFVPDKQTRNLLQNFARNGSMCQQLFTDLLLRLDQHQACLAKLLHSFQATPDDSKSSSVLDGKS